MAELLRKNLAQFVDLTEDEFAHVLSYTEEIHLAKQGHLLRQGEVCRYAFFFLEGCARYYYLREGEEQVGQFFFEGGWVSDLYSFLTELPSGMNIAAIEPCRVLAISKENLNRIYDEVPKMDRFGRKLMENTLVQVQKRSNAFLTQSPTEKYLEILQTRPKVVSRVPQYLIASYLGIKPESLSRIRKRMAEEGKETS
ncbi:MAG: Crp/Fnr family transcriptional regulator [Bacteroidota bacterium]